MAATEVMDLRGYPLTQKLGMIRRGRLGTCTVTVRACVITEAARAFHELRHGKSGYERPKMHVTYVRAGDVRASCVREEEYDGSQKKHCFL